ncbi:UDP-3-O-(3-hydroxymyristoyl)glucosamine N-acyltransferase [Myroides sp. JBRI-B21084]|uniref:UDP-3-O-(3-hydroxymyristoyl)glucosamine N-acyltransferase n=1 Tax=Myroides sp. JBRI-B21084 TaxID=3119977 RepID=UPI0026E457A0|nr:UDP-3-O-(3-hydroxymyristoyl)glucosamine N-acyltransferase [Paenimyroides cloacae]WKW47545.1 UDP-3-O-(3-hydroxymyristoyl)glucosamine N-acyltransferase [Paenimyroides cloacae]
MRFPKTYRLENIAEIIGCTFVGSPDFPVLGMNEIHVVQPGEIVFVDHPKYYDKALNSNATIILINKDVECPEGKALLISDDPFRDFNKLSTYFRPFQASSAAISSTATIGEGTILQPNVFIGNHVKIGKNCIIHANVVINDHSIIGDNVVIHAGTVLGADAFYYKKRTNFFDPLISSGAVVIEDDVTLGALCSIDRGVTGDTTIKKGTKIDNQVHIGHDTIIGEMCLIAAQCGIAGCVVIENNVTIWGQVGTTSGINIGENAVILAKAGVSKNLEGNKVYFGVPAEEAREYYKHVAKVKNLVK